MYTSKKHQHDNNTSTRTHSRRRISSRQHPARALHTRKRSLATDRPADLLNVQRTFGNQALGQMLSRQSPGMTPVIQRAVPTDKRWKKDSKRFGHKRSTELKAIDAALAAWNAQKDDDTVENATKIDLLSAVHEAIRAWKSTKSQKEIDIFKSMRIADVNRLEDEVEQERLRIEASIATGIPVSEIRDDYTDLAVFSAGSMTDNSGAFVGASADEYAATKQQLLDEGKAATDADIRIAMLAAKVREAYQRMQEEQENLTEEDDDAQAIGLFTAQEWFFKRPGTPFRESDKQKIVNAFLSLSSECTDMLIVPGSIVWSQGRGDNTRLRNTAVAMMNGQLLKQTNKRSYGFDYDGYVRRDANTGRGVRADKDRRMGDWQRGGGIDIAKGDPTGEFGISAAGDSTQFEVGNLTFSLEICADHGAKRALQDMNHRNAFPNGGAHVQVLVSHGAELTPYGSVLREGGIGVSNDGSDQGKNKKTGVESGGVRSVYQEGLDVSDISTQYTAKADLSRLFMGMYELPE